jgi:hypothetical protein
MADFPCSQGGRRRPAAVVAAEVGCAATAVCGAGGASGACAAAATGIGAAHMGAARVGAAALSAAFSDLATFLEPRRVPGAGPVAAVALTGDATGVIWARISARTAGVHLSPPSRAIDAFIGKSDCSNFAACEGIATHLSSSSR